MTEHDIEIKVEKMTDRIDRQYMEAKITDLEYRAELKRIDQWADEQYKAMATA